MEREIKTERLTLRPLTQADIQAQVRLLNDFEVSRWLTVVPYPYTEADARAFLDQSAKTGRVPWAIHVPDGLVGVVDADDGLGYWLGRRFHGRGYMTEAAGAVVEEYFARTGAEALSSGYFSGNDASARVLGKLGFQPTHTERVHARALDREVTLNKVALTRNRWEVRRGH